MLCYYMYVYSIYTSCDTNLLKDPIIQNKAMCMCVYVCVDLFNQSQKRMKKIILFR
jgi:hypothetical protein